MHPKPEKATSNLDPNSATIVVDCYCYTKKEVELGMEVHIRNLK